MSTLSTSSKLRLIAVLEAQKRELEGLNNVLRRQHFYQCPGCEEFTLELRDDGKVCPVCGWEDFEDEDATLELLAEFDEAMRRQQKLLNCGEDDEDDNEDDNEGDNEDVDDSEVGYVEQLCNSVGAAVPDAKRGALSEVNFALAAGTGLDRADKGDKDYSLLVWAARNGMTSSITKLLENGANVNFSGPRSGRTALECCAFEGHQDILKLLLDGGANVNHQNAAGETALLAAAEAGHSALVELLIEKGADMAVANEEGVAPLFMACFEGNTDVAKILLDRGASAAQANENGATALFAACQNGSVGVCSLLLQQKGTDINQPKKNGTTPVYIAAQQGYDDCLHTLLNAGANPNAATLEGATALFAASENGHAQCVKMLLSSSKEMVDHACENGCTSLWVAAQNGFADVVQLLVGAGADPSLGPGDSNAPEVAEAFGHDDLFAYLQNLS